MVLAEPAAAKETDTAPVIGRYYSESVEAPRKAPPIAKGKPNVIWLMFDDLGFGASSVFGGPVPMPNLEALANGGLKYTNFHAAPACAPTRAALLTGRNPHDVGMGGFPHVGISAGFPGYTGQLRPEDGTIAEYLRDAGYSTYALGKWHLTPDEEISDLGPFDRWPSGKGFQHYFGFLGGAEDQYKPDLVEDNRHIKPDGRHFNAQMFDMAISYIDEQQRLNADKPFFMYIAPGATHSPHQSDKVWLDRFRGKFDAGWDVWRENILKRQKEMGLIPADAQMHPRNPRVPAWDSLSKDEKRVYARFMESFAAFGTYTDWEIGRLIDHLKEKDLLDNTIIMVVMGDNGGSKEGGPHGVIDHETTPPIADDANQIAQLVAAIDKIGTGETLSNFPIGWSQATNTPFRKWKADGDAEGAVRNPLIAYWADHIPAGGVRTQYGNVIDLLPTTLEMVGIETPATVREIHQTPLDGISLSYSFEHPEAPSRRTTQYYFLQGAGAIYHDGWKATFGYRPDFVDLFRTYPLPDRATLPNNAGKEVWELYNLNVDFNERHDIARKYPEKLIELKALFDREAKANDVYPLINWTDLYLKSSNMMEGILEEDRATSAK